MKGAYILVIKINKNIKKKIGSLGYICFEKGMYVYIGSAMNSIEKRVGRHLRKKKKKFWHIDYLLDSKDVKIEKVFYKESKRKEECKIAKSFSLIGSGVRNFGCSDCKCESHLYKIKNLKSIKIKELNEFN